MKLVQGVSILFGIKTLKYCVLHLYHKDRRCIRMGISKTTKKKRKAKTKQLSIRVPESILECINLLVDLGLFKDRSDFINYSLKEVLKEYLMNIKINISPEIVDKYFVTLEQVSPRLSEKESLKLLKNLRQSRGNLKLEKN